MARRRSSLPAAAVTSAGPFGMSPWSLLIAAALMAQMVWLGATAVADPDTWWHLKTGQLILQTHSIPKTDPYSYVLAGGPWITFEWLFEVLSYGVYSLAGAMGLAVMRGVVLCAAFLLFFRLAGGGFWAGAFMSLGALVMRDYFYTRPQIFDYLLMGVFLTIMDRDRGRPRSAWMLPGLQVLWVNLHGGAALVGVGLLGLKALSCFALARSEEPRGRLGLPEGFWSWSAVAAACLLAMLVNPHGYRIFTHTYATLSFPGLEMISEWAPLKPLLSPKGLFLAMGVVAALLSWRSQTHLALAALVLAVLGWRQIRHVSLAALAIAPLSARLMERLRPVRLGRVSAVASLAVMTALSGLFIRSHVAYLTNVGVGLQDLPDRAIRYLDDNDVEGRMFSSYSLGGYLIWKTWPRRQVFVDGRGIEYGPDFIRDAIHWNWPDVWSRLVARWRFDYAIISNSYHYDSSVLDSSPEWALVFWDDAALVYLRRTPANEALIRRDAYRLLKPNQTSFGYLENVLRDKAAVPALLAELDRSVRGSDRNVNAVQMRAYAFVVLGRPSDAIRDLESVIERFPRMPGPYMSLAWSYEKTGRMPEARKVYEDGIRVAQWAHDEVSLAQLENNLGAIEMRLGHRARARELFLDCLEKVPGHPQAQLNLRKLDAAP